MILHLYTDQGDKPGMEIATWGPYAFASNANPGSDLVVDTPAGPILNANTKYWLSMTADPVTSEHGWMQSALSTPGKYALRSQTIPAWTVSSLPDPDDGSLYTVMRLEGIRQ